MGILRELGLYPRLLTRVLPLVERELSGWRHVAGAIPNSDLRDQALSSLHRKKFHCVGGSVLALGSPEMLPELVRAIVAIQTISDYLDNLCDRSAVAEKVHDDGKTEGTRHAQAMEGTSRAPAMAQRTTVSKDGKVPQPGTSAGSGPSHAPGGPGHEATGPAHANRPNHPAYEAYTRLHESLLCAVDPDRRIVDFYESYACIARDCPGDENEDRRPPPEGENRRPPEPGRKTQAPGDGGYLRSLIEASRSVLGALPGYEAARPCIVDFVTLYSEMQARKHLPVGVREIEMDRWWWREGELRRAVSERDFRGCGDGPGGMPESLGSRVRPVSRFDGCELGARGWLGRDLYWWEYGAAAGSTLGIFALICGSAAPCVTPSVAASLADAYFPAICCLHILLDYYIDRDEDAAGGDLNFVAQYASENEAADALETFIRWSLSVTSNCENAELHTAVVRGLLAMYLSDPKVRSQGFDGERRRWARAGRGPTSVLTSACELSRRILKF